MLREIAAIIQELDYDALTNERRPVSNGKRAAGILIILLAGYMLLRQFGFAKIFNLFPTAKKA